MKTHPTLYRQDGNVLVVCLFTCAIIGFAIASCFVYVRNQMVSAARSQSWNESLVLSEAGIEDGMAFINKHSGTTTPRGTWAITGFGADNWTRISTGPSVFWVQRSLNGSFYDAYVTNNADGQPTIRSVATKKFAGGQIEIQRAVWVKTVPASIFQGGLIAKGSVGLQGNVVVDSFNSQVAGQNVNGQYDPSIRRDNGSIASASSNVVATVSFGGSVEVYGKVFTGPEDGVTNSGNVAIGSTAFVNGSSTGVQSGYAQNDFNVYIPDAPAAPTGGLPLPPKNTYSFQGSTYLGSYLLGSASGSTVYQQNNIQLTTTETILVQGNVKLYVPINFKMSGQSKVIIGTNSSLTIYAGGSVDLSGGGVVNLTGNATNLTLNGLPSCTSIQYTGGSDYIGTIYAPQAAMKMSGGGNNVYNLVGSVVAGSIDLNGKYQVHYDESLIQLPAGQHYYASSWREIPVQKVKSGPSTQTF